MDISKIIKAEIQKSALLQKDVAEKIGDTAQNLNNKLKLKDISTDLIRKISEVIEVNLFSIIAKAFEKTEYPFVTVEKFYNEFEEPIQNYSSNRSINSKEIEIKKSNEDVIQILNRYIDFYKEQLKENTNDKNDLRYSITLCKDEIAHLKKEILDLKKTIKGFKPGPKAKQ